MKKYLHLIGIVLFVLIILNINVKDVWINISHSNWMILALVGALNLLVMLLRSYRWVKLLEIQGHSLGVGEAYSSYLRSFYLGSITPARVGELFRVHYLMKYVDLNSAKAFSSILFDRVLDMYFILILGVIGLLMSNVWHSYEWVKLVFVAFTFIIPVFISCPKLTLSFVKVLPNFWNFRNKTITWLEHFFEGVKCFLSTKISFSVFLTFVIYILFFLQCLLLADAMYLNIDFFYLAFCVVVFSILSILPISFSNMGTREFVLIFMFNYIGISSEFAVSYSLLFFVFINVVIAVFGWVLFAFYTDREDKIESYEPEVQA